MTELERRLREWGKEYGGSRYDDIAWPSSSAMAILIKYHGRAPDNLNPRAVLGTSADQVEDAVRVLAAERTGRERAAIIRTEYWMRNAAMEHKLQCLRERHRVNIGVRGYYTQLQLARSFLAGWLRLPVREPSEVIPDLLRDT